MYFVLYQIKLTENIGLHALKFVSEVLEKKCIVRFNCEGDRFISAKEMYTVTQLTE